MASLSTALGRIGIDQRGGGDGTPLVFLHGVGSDKSAWAPQLAHFGAARRTIAFDAPGYGESDPLQSGEGAMHDRFAAAILAALDALAIDRAHVCGLSLGGVVALALANAAPERIESLILADTFARHPDGPAILARSLAASADMRAMAEARVPALLAPDPDPDPVPDPALVAGLVEVMARIGPAAFRLAAQAVWPADQRDRAACIAVPTLILCGREDRVTPPALSAELAALIAGARIAFIDGAGHLPNLERPADFNAALDDFFAER